jgi:hypothetical protein
MPSSVSPAALGVKGSTQPEVFRATVDAMAQQLALNAASFWQDSLAQDGPITVWIINGERYLYNGNHRFQAALQAEVEIPADAIQVEDKAGSQIPTFLLEDLTWVPGFK